MFRVLVQGVRPQRWAVFRIPLVTLFTILSAGLVLLHGASVARAQGQADSNARSSRRASLERTLQAKPPSNNPRIKEAVKRARERKNDVAKTGAKPNTKPRAAAAPAKGDRKVKQSNLKNERKKKQEQATKSEKSSQANQPKRVEKSKREPQETGKRRDTVRDRVRSVDDERQKEPASPPVARRRIRQPAPPLPEPVYNETERALQQSLELRVLDLGPSDRWVVNLTNRSLQPLRIATDPRLLAFTARIPGRTEAVSCEVPKALQPQGRHVETEVLAPGESYEFRVDPRMYCFESGDQTILVPGTFLVPNYGWPEATRTRWSWGRRYEERLEQHHPFAGEFVGPEAEPPEEVAKRQGLKRVVGEGFALSSEYEGWAKTRLRDYELGDAPQHGLKLTISHGADAPHARDIAVTVKLQNLSTEPQRVYFRRDLVSFIIEGPDGDTECEATSAEWRAPDPQAFITLRPGKSESFTTRLLEFCPAQSFQRPGFYYVRAVLPGTAPSRYGQEEVFTGELAASAPRPIRLHQAELPYFSRGPSGRTAMRGRGGDAQAIIPPPPQPPPPPTPAPPPPPVQ